MWNRAMAPRRGVDGAGAQYIQAMAKETGSAGPTTLEPGSPGIKFGGELKKWRPKPWSEASSSHTSMGFLRPGQTTVSSGQTKSTSDKPSTEEFDSDSTLDPDQSQVASASPRQASEM